MKRISITIIATAALLAGCGQAQPTVAVDEPVIEAKAAEPTPTPTVAPTPVPTSVPTPAPIVDMEELFLDVLRDSYPGAFYGVPDSLMVDTAEAACRALDRGASLNDLLMASVGTGFPARAAGGLIGAGVVAFCPEHEGKIA